MIDPSHPDFQNTPASPHRPSFDYSPADPGAVPHVTIITPFYNTGPVFHETAQSVLRQSFQQWEWLIINDGSPDPAALEVCQQYRHLDPRISVIDHQHNRGLSAARNTGFRAARTDYVVQIDSDDLLEPCAIEKWLWYLQSHPEYGFVKGFTVGFEALEYLWERGFHDGRAMLEENLVAPTAMIRRQVHERAGGYDEDNRGGLEDWDFWLRCANAGFWGGTIHEYHDWYRRRPTHTDRWSNWDNGPRCRDFKALMQRRYPRLWNGDFPEIPRRWFTALQRVPHEIPFANQLRKNKPRLLMILPWMTMGGADKFNLDLLAQLTLRGWEVSVATTLPSNNPWLPQFARYTPDIFVLDNFLVRPDYPRFLTYLIQSRQHDVVLVSNSELGYLLLPALRAACPGVAFIDYNHMEEEGWKNGGYPNLGVLNRDLLDLSLVTSKHLRSWMVRRGADPERTHVCYINVEPEPVPEENRRCRLRQELGIVDETPVILYPARICAQKQPLVLARTMQLLHEDGLDFVALVAGDGPDRPVLEQALRQGGIEERVRLLGAQPHRRVRELLVAADVLFLPSQWEGIALSIYEAMAFGLPVVGADVGGQRELLTPECGVLLPCSTPEEEARAYANCLADLIRSPQRRRDMGAAGRNRIATHFRLEQMGERMDSLCREAIRLHRESPRLLLSPAQARLWATYALELTRVQADADQVWHERTRLLNVLAAERERFTTELLAERNRVAESQRLLDELAQAHQANALVEAHWRSLSWRLTAPLRRLKSRLRGRPYVGRPHVRTVQEAEHHINLLSRTLSWRVTAPLRWMKRKLQRLLHQQPVVPAQVEVSTSNVEPPHILRHPALLEHSSNRRIPAGTHKQGMRTRRAAG